MLVCTISTDIRFGRTWRLMMRVARAPIALAASTNSRSLTARTGPRTTRAKMGVYTMPIAMITFAGFGPNAATMPSASRTVGKANSTSMVRMMIWSGHPPAYPAIKPSADPTTNAIATDTTDTCSDSRAPNTIRLRMSRPNVSAPSGNAQLGPAIRLEPTICSGLRSGSRSAVRASSTNTVTMTRPIAAAWLPNSRRGNAPTGARRLSVAPLGVANPGIEEAIEHVHQRVGGDEQRCDHEHSALDERVVALIDRVEQHAPDAGE